MRISIIHPSRSRPEMALKTAKQWLESADEPTRINYTLSIDASDLNRLHYYEWFFGMPVLIVSNPNKSAIEAINVAVRPSDTGLIIVVSDDFSAPKGWDKSLRKALEEKSDFIVKTQDGIQPTLITLPIMDKAYYDRFGYIYNPEYIHMHSDEEMTIVGHMLGKVITLPLIFKHNHYSTGAMKRDAINAKNDRTYAQGKAVLERHALNNFGIENPVIQRKDIKWK